MFKNKKIPPAKIQNNITSIAITMGLGKACKIMQAWIVCLLVSFHVSALERSKDPRYLGCYKETAFKSGFWDEYTNGVSGPMTIEGCITRCAGLPGRQYLSALKNGRECWCSKKIPDYMLGTPSCDDCCETPCFGDSSQICGGTATMDMYDSVVDRRYLGCYKDKAAPDRALSTALPDDPQLDIDKCIDECGQRGFAFAGARIGECFCGHDDYLRHGHCITDGYCFCSYICHADSVESCGGYWAVSVYKAECRSEGAWGAGCNDTCTCDNGVTCNITTGQCDCLAGWQGLTCNETCPQGRYGENCEQACVQCSDSECDRFTGECSKGCAEGLQGFPTCDEVCPDGKFGKDCSLSCNCQNDELCNKKDGTCPSGVCKPGYDESLDTSCQTECETGKFGLNCQYHCNCYKGSECDKSTGFCEDDQCAPGFTGHDDNPACQKECDDGTYGIGCGQECHCLRSPCEKVNGNCLYGLCAPGYTSTDNTCGSPCDNGKFGLDCALTCHCHNEDCIKDTGECPSGVCAPGFDYSVDPSCSVGDGEDGGGKSPTSPALVVVAVLLGISLLAVVILVVILLHYKNKPIPEKDQNTYAEIPDSCRGLPNNNFRKSDEFFNKPIMTTNSTYLKPISGNPLPDLPNVGVRNGTITSSDPSKTEVGKDYVDMQQSDKDEKHSYQNIIPGDNVGDDAVAEEDDNGYLQLDRQRTIDMAAVRRKEQYL